MCCVLCTLCTSQHEQYMYKTLELACFVHVHSAKREMNLRTQRIVCCVCCQKNDVCRIINQRRNKIYIIIPQHRSEMTELETSQTVLINLDIFETIRITYHFRSRTWAIVGIARTRKEITLEAYSTYEEAKSACDDMISKLIKLGEAVNINDGCPEYVVLSGYEENLPFN